jgi:hypothetical protein
MSSVSDTLIEGQDRIELVRTELGRAREVMDRVDTGLEIAEDILENTEKVLEASRRLLPVVLVVAGVVGIGIAVGVYFSRRASSQEVDEESELEA